MPPTSSATSETPWAVWRRRIRLIWVSGGLLFTAWIVWNMQAHGVAAETFRSSPTVTVERGDHATAFLPTAPKEIGGQAGLLVFLPGGAVDPDAYGPAVRALAEQGWPVVLVELPWRVAFTDGQRAEVWRRVEAARQHWGPEQPVMLGGHSRGAALSARFAFEHPEALGGLYLIGTTHPRDFSLAARTLPTLKISGDHDCVAPEADSRRNQPLLPAGTTWRTIAGANHAQFAYYGTQLGDCAATIDRQAQQRQLISVLDEWLLEMSQR